MEHKTECPSLHAASALSCIPTILLLPPCTSTTGEHSVQSKTASVSHHLDTCSHSRDVFPIVKIFGAAIVGLPSVSRMHIAAAA